MYDVLLVPLALVLFGVLAFKRWSAIIIGPLISLLLVVAADMPVFKSMLGPYMAGSAAYVKNFFLVLFRIISLSGSRLIGTVLNQIGYCQIVLLNM